MVAGGWRHAWTYMFVWTVMLYLYTPIAVTVIFSFANSPRLSLPIEGLTLHAAKLLWLQFAH